jgi:hypothetical protein
MRFTLLRSASCTLMLLNGLIASSGCGGPHAADNDPAPDPEAPTSLIINNDNLLDAIVYVYHDGQASRVGTVTASSSANFMLARWLLGPTRNIRLAAHPIGSTQSVNSDLIHVQPGQFIEWRLATELAASTVSVY